MNAERQTHSEDDMALDLGGLLRTIGRSLGWLVPLTLFVTVVVFLGLQFVAPKYKGEARLIIESMDADHKSRSLVPVALATGGYVDLMNAGWDHQRALDCGGYNCLQRLMTFHTTVALRRG